MSARARSVVLVLLLLGSALALAPSIEAQGRKVAFEATKFDDTMFAAVDGVFRVTFDETGDLWYSTQAGVVHVSLAQGTREFFTHQDGLPSSYALGLAHKGNKVYVGTDLGLGIIDRTTGNVTALTTANSKLHDDIIQEVVVDGDDVWIGGYFQGIAVWNTTTDDWAYKNTSTTTRYADPVRRIAPSADGVWVATAGNGAWHYDRSLGNVSNESAWSVLLKADGLPSSEVLSVATRGPNVYFGTDKGLVRWAGYAPYKGTSDEWLHYNKTRGGMPDERVLDVDIIVTAEGTADVFASTRAGVWQLNVDSGNAITRSQSFGILGAYVLDNTFTRHGWAFASQRGVSLLRGETWTYYTTGPSEGASPGPNGFLFSSASIGESPFMWFGSGAGLSAFDPAANGGRGVWYNLGEWQYYPGSTVNAIDVDNGVVWIATTAGVYGYDIEKNQWVSKLARSPSRNLVYGIEADRNELWIPLFGEGLLHQNLTTGVSRSWDITSAVQLPDIYLTDVRVQGNDVWLGSGIGAIRLDKVSGTVKATYTSGDGLPGNGVVFKVIPDGTVTWIGTKTGGVARLDAGTGKVTRVWNETNSPGFPGGEVRSILREGGRLWVGTTEGLAKINVATGTFQSYNQSNSGLVQNFVNGISERDGILYLATLSGVARLDIVTNQFLPMRDGPNVSRGTGVGANVTSTISVRIDSPQDGRAVTGIVDIKGRASRFGSEIDRVEVRIGEGEWLPAEGTSQWTYTWNSTGLEGQIPVAARAFVGENASRETEILLTVVELPTIPLVLDHTSPTNATAGRAVILRADARGDEPLGVTAFYKRPGQETYTRLTLARTGPIFIGQVPAKDVREGELTYYIEARSGLLTESSPENPERPHRVPVGPPPRLAVGVEGPRELTIRAGTTQTFDLDVTNTGTQPATFLLTASGLRSSWLTLSTDPLALEPGASKVVKATLTVPPAAFADATNFTFEARDSDGVAQAASATVPVTILAAEKTEPTPAPTNKSKGFFGIPGPGILAATLALAGAALVLRRRS